VYSWLSNLLEKLLARGNCCFLSVHTRSVAVNFAVQYFVAAGCFGAPPNPTPSPLWPSDLNHSPHQRNTNTYEYTINRHSFLLASHHLPHQLISSSSISNCKPLKSANLRSCTRCPIVYIERPDAYIPPRHRHYCSANSILAHTRNVSLRIKETTPSPAVASPTDPAACVWHNLRPW
jgi:hypothetical protein